MKKFVGAAALAVAAEANLAQFNTDVKQIGVDLAKWNKGMMKSLMINPDDTTTTCYTHTVDANA